MLEHENQNTPGASPNDGLVPGIGRAHLGKKQDQDPLGSKGLLMTLSEERNSSAVWASGRPRLPDRLYEHADAEQPAWPSNRQTTSPSCPAPPRVILPC